MISQIILIKLYCHIYVLLSFINIQMKHYISYLGAVSSIACIDMSFFIFMVTYLFMQTVVIAHNKLLLLIIIIVKYDTTSILKTAKHFIAKNITAYT